MTHPTGKTFNPYQIFIIAILSILQFTLILDFMVLSPLGAILMPEMNINTRQFGWVVSAYAFSAGISGILAAGFADRFDRKRLLLFFYAGFIIGTFLCGLAPDYHLLLAARIITGLFGGVIGSIIFAIITDLFAMQVRGRVMGYVQMAFASSQVLGLPVGLYLANKWGWHSPFILIASLSVVVFVAIIFKMRPVNAHLAIQSGSSPFMHLWKTISQKRYLQGFAATMLLATGGFMLMPFASAYTVNNLGITLDHLPMIYMVTGLCSMVAGPLLGKLVDSWGKYRVFFAGSVLTMIVILIYTHLGITPLWQVIVLNAVLFVGITSRIISSSALNTAVPDAADRGAYMGVNASLSQFAGGIASMVAGLIVIQSPTGYLERYPLLGFVVIGAMIVTLWMMHYIHLYVKNKMAEGGPVAGRGGAVPPAGAERVLDAEV